MTKEPELGTNEIYIPEIGIIAFNYYPQERYHVGDNNFRYGFSNRVAEELNNAIEKEKNCKPEIVGRLVSEDSIVINGIEYRNMRICVRLTGAFKENGEFFQKPGVTVDATRSGTFGETLSYSARRKLTKKIEPAVVEFYEANVDKIRLDFLHKMVKEAKDDLVSMQSFAKDALEQITTKVEV